MRHPVRKTGWRLEYQGMQPDRSLCFRAAETQDLNGLVEGDTLEFRFVQEGVPFFFRTTLRKFSDDPCRRVLVDPPSSIQPIDLRRHERMDCFFPGRFLLGERVYSCHLVDVGNGGCRIVLQGEESPGHDEIPLGSSGELEFRLLSACGTQRTEAHVLHKNPVQGGVGIGMAFHQLPFFVLEALERMKEALAQPVYRN
ncbi:MAG: PilZ domain-containing protein [Desulfovibrionales bacterium]